MRRDNGSTFAILAVAAVSAAAFASKSRSGGFNEIDDEDEGEGEGPLEAEIVTQMVVARPQRSRSMGAALQRRRQAELQMPDRQVARRIFSLENPLGRMTFEEAVNEDPRRIDALISQRVGQTFMEADGRAATGGAMESALYLEGLRIARQFNDGNLPVKALVSLTEENMERALFTQFPRLPSFIKDHLRRQMHVFERGFNEAADIAMRASRVSQDPEDARDWRSLEEFLREHPDQIRRALSDALPGPVPGRQRALPGQRRMLPPPRGGRNHQQSLFKGSRYECEACRGDHCPAHSHNEDED